MVTDTNTMVVLGFESSWQHVSEDHIIYVGDKEHRHRREYDHSLDEAA